eukprot:tig00000042_g15483.t1
MMLARVGLRGLAAVPAKSAAPAMAKPKMMDVLLLGQRALREPAVEINPAEIKTSKIQELARNLVHTMKELNESVLAAPQVNKGIRMFVMENAPEDYDEEKGGEIPTVLAINPQIKTIDEEDAELGWETSASAPDICALVPRSNKIEVEYTDPSGKVVKTELTGEPARLFQHAVDQLDGVGFLERVMDNRLIIMAEELEEFENTCDDILGGEDEEGEDFDFEEEEEPEPPKKQLPAAGSKPEGKPSKSSR